MRRCPNGFPKHAVIGKLIPRLVERQGKDDLELLLGNFRVGTSGPEQLILDALPQFLSPRGLATLIEAAVNDRNGSGLRAGRSPLVDGGR